MVAEAKTRQVIVFTHDLSFLRLLLDESEKQGVACENQYVRREETKPEFVRLTGRWLQCPSRSASESSKSFRKRQIRRIGRSAKRHMKAQRGKFMDSERPGKGQLPRYYFMTWWNGITEYRDEELCFLHDITKEDCDCREGNDRMLRLDKGTRPGSRRWNSCSWSSGVEVTD